MPSRPSISPWRVPLGFVRLRSFPEGEVIFVLLIPLLIGLFRLCFGLLHTFQLPVFEFLLICLNIEVNGSVGRIRVSIGYDFLDEGHNLRDVLCDPCNIVGKFDSELPG
jgi:hypothetical protein